MVMLLLKKVGMCGLRGDPEEDFHSSGKWEEVTVCVNSAVSHHFSSDWNSRQDGFRTIFP